ncbi:MAG: hypothetical protein QOE63_1253 [Acidimicrobiaceae bacterium]
MSAGIGGATTMSGPGPGTLAWRRMADDRVLLIGGATLVLQVAEPPVRVGVEQHSGFKAAPPRRLCGTLASLTRVLYGTEAEACAEVERLRGMHRTALLEDAARTELEDNRCRSRRRWGRAVRRCCRPAR